MATYRTRVASNILVVAAVSVVLAVGTASSICTSATKVVGTFVMPTYVQDIVVLDNYAYIADWTAGLQILDVSVPETPQVVAIVATSDARAVAIARGYAFLADGEFGLKVIDVTEPNDPELVGSIDTPGEANGVCVDGDYAYIADGLSGLHIIRVSNVSAPVLVSSVDTPFYAYDVAVLDGYAYVPDGTSGVRVIDVFPVNQAAEIAFENTPGYAEDIELVGDKAYVADGSGGLQVIDITTPGSPFIAGSTAQDSGARDIAVAGTTLLVAGVDLLLIDVSDPSDPQTLDSVWQPGGAYRVCLLGTDRAFVAQTQSGNVMVVDLTPPDILVGSIATAGGDIARSGSHIFTAEGASGLQIIDVSVPAAPMSLGSIDTDGSAKDVAVAGTLAYVADGTAGLKIVDAAVPSAPVVVGSLALQEAFRVAVSGQYAYVFTEQFLPPFFPKTLYVVDASTPSSPTVVGSMVTGSFGGIVIDNGYMYVASGSSGLVIRDVSSPASPQVVGSVDTPQLAFDVAVAANTAYVADRSGGLHVIDVSVPATPAIVGSVAIEDAFSVAVVGQHAYVVDYAARRLYAVDVSIPTSPTIAATADVEFRPSKVLVDASYVYVSGSSYLGYSGAVRVYPLLCPVPSSAYDDAPSMSELRLVRNDVGQVLLRYQIASGAQRVALGIYDVRGRLVRSLHRGHHDAGQHSRVWDAQDARGQAVAAGVYLVQLQVDSHRYTGKGVVLR